MQFFRWRSCSQGICTGAVCGRRPRSAFAGSAFSRFFPNCGGVTDLLVRIRAYLSNSFQSKGSKYKRKNNLLGETLLCLLDAELLGLPSSSPDAELRGLPSSSLDAKLPWIVEACACHLFWEVFTAAFSRSTSFFRSFLSTVTLFD